MDVNVYNKGNEFLRTIENVEEIKPLNDGRYFITYPKKCESCGHVENYTWQIPQGYRIEIKEN